MKCFFSIHYNKTLLGHNYTVVICHRADQFKSHEPKSQFGKLARMNHQSESWRWLSWFSVWDASDSQSLTAALTQTKTRTVTPWPAHSISKDSLFEAVWFFYRSLGFVVYLRNRLALKQAVKQEMRRSVGSVGSNTGLREREWVGGGCSSQMLQCMWYTAEH